MNRFSREFAYTNITVNGLAPAVFNTKINKNTLEKQLEYGTATIPMQWFGTVDKVAAMSYYPVCDDIPFYSIYL